MLDNQLNTVATNFCKSQNVKNQLIESLIDEEKYINTILHPTKDVMLRSRQIRMLLEVLQSN